MYTRLSAEVPNQENRTILEGTTASNDVLSVPIQSPNSKMCKARDNDRTSPPPSEDFEPAHKKPRVDNDIESGDSHTTPPSSEGSQKTPQNPPFGCGCGKCTFFSFIERGCPTPIPSTSSFPYLDVSGLTHEQQQELRGRLQSESQQIMIQFQKLVSATIKSLDRQNVSPYKLLCHIMTLGAFKHVFKINEMPQVPALHHCYTELKAAKTIYEIFWVLNDYFSFFNYHIIEHIIEELGTEEDKAKLQKYKENFSRYAKRRIFECLPEFGLVSDADHADVFVKVDTHYDDCTVADIEMFRHKLSEILHLSSQGILRLCRIDKGCFQLMFQVPSFVQQMIFPLSREQEKALAAMHVMKLICGEYQFLVKLSVFLLPLAINIIMCTGKRHKGLNIVWQICYYNFFPTEK